MGRNTQGVRLINLTKKNDVIASVCKVMSSELEASVEEESRAQWALKSENIRRDNLATSTEPELDEKTESSDDIEPSEQ
jgi:DNA gyrase subunit A